MFSEQVSFKYDLAKFMNYQINLVKKLGIKVVLNTEATPELIEAQKADWVLAAVGANAFVPPIPGTDGPNVMIAEECYKHIDEIGERVVLIGGGEVGCETALALAEKGKKVSIIEMLPELCPETFHLTRGVMLGKMEKCVDMYTGARCTGITTEGVSFVDKDGNEQFVPCDVVVMFLRYASPPGSGRELPHDRSRLHAHRRAASLQRTSVLPPKGFDAATRI